MISCGFNRDAKMEYSFKKEREKSGKVQKNKQSGGCFCIPKVGFENSRVGLQNLLPNRSSSAAQQILFRWAAKNALLPSRFLRANGRNKTAVRRINFVGFFVMLSKL